MLIGSGSKRSPPQANSNRWISVKFAPLVTGQRRMAYLAAGTALFYDEMRKGIKSNFIAFK